MPRVQGGIATERSSTLIRVGRRSHLFPAMAPSKLFPIQARPAQRLYRVWHDHGVHPLGRRPAQEIDHENEDDGENENDETSSRVDRVKVTPDGVW